MKRSKTTFNGDTLILPDWSFGSTDARVPHRKYIVAQCDLGAGVTVWVRRNQPASLFWVHASGPGLAGDRSRRSNTVATNSKGLANLWINAVNQGKVRIE